MEWRQDAKCFVRLESASFVHQLLPKSFKGKHNGSTGATYGMMSSLAFTPVAGNGLSFQIHRRILISLALELKTPTFQTFSEDQ